LAYIPLALESALRFVIAEEEAKRLWSLMSIDDHKLMMLFVVEHLKKLLLLLMKVYSKGLLS